MIFILVLNSCNFVNTENIDSINTKEQINLDEVKNKFLVSIQDSIVENDNIILNIKVEPKNILKINGEILNIDSLYSLIDDKWNIIKDEGINTYLDIQISNSNNTEFLFFKKVYNIIVDYQNERKDKLSYSDYGKRYSDLSNSEKSEVSLSKEIQANPGRYIKSDIIDKVLLRDLPSLYGIQDVQELNSLFTTIAFNSGNEFSYDNLSTTSGVSKNTIKNYQIKTRRL